MKSDLDILINLVANTKGMRQEYQQAAAAQVALNREMNRGKQAATVATSGLNQVQKQSALLTGSLRSVAGVAASVFGVLSAKNAALDIKDTLADYQQFSTRLRFLSEDSADYASTMGFLDDLATQHGKTILSLGDSYTSLAALRKGDLLSMQQSRDLLTGLSNAQSALGVESSKLELTLYGLGQALSQPTVQTQEFNQVVEPLPGLMQALTRAAGLQGKSYRDLVLAGEVTSDMLRDDLIKALKEYDGAAKANIDNIKAQEDELENLRIKTIAAFEEPIDNVYGTMLDAASSSLLFLKENASAVTSTLEILTVAGLLRGTAALTNYTTATVTKKAATIAAAKADLTQAQAQVNLARTQTGLIGLTDTTTAAKARLKVATDALTVAQLRYNAVALTGTRVARGLMAAMGGIPGIVLLGGYALYEWASSADSAADKTSNLTSEIEALHSAMNPFSEYTKTQATSALQRYTAQLEIAEKEAQEIRDRFNNPYFEVAASDVLEAEKAVEDLTTKISLLNQVLKTPLKSENGTSRGLQEKYEKIISDLEKQVALYGTVGEASKIAYETAYGALKNLSAEEKAQLILSASRVDAKKNEIDTARQLREEFSRTLNELKNQTAMYGTVGEAAKVAYETAYGSLKNLTAEEKAQLILAASRLDAKKAEIDSARKLQEETDRLISQQAKELALFGDSSAEAKLRYELEHGSLKAINDELREKLILQAQELDQLNEAKRLKSEVERIAVAAQSPIQRENSNYKENLGTLETYRDSLPESDLTKRQEINQLIEMEHLRHNKALEDISRNSQTEIDQLWTETFDRFIAGTGRSVADALFESENLGDGLRSVLRDTAKNTVAALSEMGAKAVAEFAIIAAKRLFLSGVNVTATTTEAAAATAAMTSTGAAITGAMAPAAAATTLATGGANGATSIGAIAAVGAALSAMFAGLFDKGGNISAGKFGIVGERGYELVQGPAYVTSRQRTEKMFTAANGRNSGGASNFNYIDNSQHHYNGTSEEMIEQFKAITADSQAAMEQNFAQQIRRRKGPIGEAYA